MKNAQSVFTRTWDKKDTRESRQSAHTGDETTTTTAEEKKQNIKAGEGHQITTALSLLKATIWPSPFLVFFPSEVDELVNADR